MQGFGIIAESCIMFEMFERVLRLSVLSDIPVLITGETGTGKELVARAIHQLDPKRSKGPFIPLNCAAITPDLADSELFGHRRGAFTGAEKDRKGLIQFAERGILFLDEVGELSLSLQVKLLRVLQEGRVRTVGDEKEATVNLRILAATNRDLPGMVKEGTFRSDLFHRLNVLSVAIPPLHQRIEDVVALVHHFFEKHGVQRRGCSVCLQPPFVEALKRHKLPGNVRQLENIVVKAIANKEDDTPFDLPDLPSDVLEELSGDVMRIEADSATVGSRVKAQELKLECDSNNLHDIEKQSLSHAMAQYERLLLWRALKVTNGNQSQAAQLLHVSSRTMYNKLRKYHFLRM
jgi:transcriptional regulator with PAS, ATPase and Fis domain